MPQYPTKAYKNPDFLNSAPARHIRILCEYEETRQRFLRHGVHNTVVMFGSARTLPGDVARSKLDEARAAQAAAPNDATARKAVVACEHAVRMSRFYDDARSLAEKLTRWSDERAAGRRYMVATGGGPGIMEAGNRGGG